MSNITFSRNRICRLFKIDFPIIQAGMVWCSGWRLASAVSNNGGLGLIGAGSMTPDLLEEHILKIHRSTNKPFGVNIPLMKQNVDKLLEVCLKNNVKIIFTSAGNPATYTKELKRNGCIVTHVVSGSKFAKKAIDAGVDAVVAEGFEAGGHNGREETATLALIPQISSLVPVPLIAAGGIYSGRSMLAAMALGAEAVQIGSRFAVSKESSAHENFKKLVIKISDGDTRLSLKKIAPARLIKNKFYKQVEELEDKGASAEELKNLLGYGRSKKGIFEGDLEEGELEIGQVSALINSIESAKDIINSILVDFEKGLEQLNRSVHK